MAHSRFYWLLPLTPLGWRRRASLTACCLPPRLPAWHSSVAIVETRGVSLGGQVDLLLLADAARTRLGGSGSTTCHGVTSRGIRTKSNQNVTFIKEQIKYHQFAFCCSFQSFLSDPFPSRSPLWFVLFAESAVPSDDDDMIGYDVGLRPQPPPPPSPAPAPAAETPSSDCCNGCQQSSFVRCSNVVAAGDIEVVADGKRNTGNVYSIFSLSKNTLISYYVG